MASAIFPACSARWFFAPLPMCVWRAGAPDPIATDTVNRVVSGNYATPAAAFATASWMRKPRLATSAFRRAGGPGTLSKFLRFSEARRSFSTNVEEKFQEQPEAGRADCDVSKPCCCLGHGLHVTLHSNALPAAQTPIHMNIVCLWSGSMACCTQ
jgi:hypothetical protein